MSMLDTVILGGDVIDGSGAPARRADVGIMGDRIVKIGRVEDSAHTTVDASGKIVSPGFIDVHTHFDAQVFWDGALTPSPLHGVTTALAGNCGFSIAPLSDDPSDGEYLMRMLARVEGMPLESLREGVPWNWKSTGDYLDAIEGRLGINAAFMVGHSAIRRVVMGYESSARAASEGELASMDRLLRDGLEAGGLGFSSSWARTHNDADGNMVPSRYASREELIHLCGILRDFEGTSLEFIPMNGPRFEPWAVDLMADMSAAARRQLNWNVMIVSAASLEACREKLKAADHAAAKGGKVVALTVPMTFGARLNFASGFVFDAMPEWEGVMLAPLAQKLEVFRDPVGRARLDALAQSPENPLLPVANWADKVIFDVVAPENEQYRGLRVGDIAKELGRDPWDVLCDIVVADDLNTSFGTIPLPETDEDWEARLEIWRDGRAVIGASDAGAHLDLLASFNYATELLGKAVRAQQLLSFEEAIHFLTEVPARLYGVKDRGRVAEGCYADLVVLDPTTVGSGEVAMRFDLPGGAGRLYAGADGIEHVLVNGRQIVADGRLTDERSGKLLRSGRDTETASLR
jgi:N-acyl-D-aspartate/D-glutamate deacylase